MSINNITINIEKSQDCNIYINDCTNRENVNKNVINDNINTEDEVINLVKTIYNPKKTDNMQLSKTYYELSNDHTIDYYYNKVVRLRDCSNYLKFTRINGKVKLIQTNSCRVRLCPICAYKRSLAVYRNVRSIYALLQRQPRNKYLFLTLTVRNVAADELQAAIDGLNAGYVRLMRNKAYKTITLGAIRTIEVTYNAARGDYHPHIHALIHTSNDIYCGRNYISQQQLKADWERVNNLDYDVQVDIRRFHARNAAAAGKELAEIAKYAVKPSDYVGQTAEVVATFDKALHQRKLITMSGSFRKAAKELHISDVETDDTYLADIKTAEDEGEIIIYKWHYGRNEYISQ
jgi:plasmid rolling circle replication initiator protein Rep